MLPVSAESIIQKPILAEVTHSAIAAVCMHIKYGTIAEKILLAIGHLNILGSFSQLILCNDDVLIIQRNSVCPKFANYCEIFLKYDLSVWELLQLTCLFLWQMDRLEVISLHTCMSEVKQLQLAAWVYCL